MSALVRGAGRHLAGVAIDKDINLHAGSRFRNPERNMIRQEEEAKRPKLVLDVTLTDDLDLMIANGWGDIEDRSELPSDWRTRKNV